LRIIARTRRTGETILEINMDDVIAVVQSIQAGLITIAIFLVLAIVVTVSVNRRTVQNTAARKRNSPTPP